MKRTLLCLLLCGLLCLSAGCRAPEDETLYNGDDATEVTIGVAYPVASLEGDTLFEAGLEMAVADINAAGGVMGRPVSLLVRDDENDTTLATQIAQTFIDQGITAVIGHWSTNVTYIVEDVYEEAGVVMITPNATGDDIFDYAYDYIFRMISTNDEYAKAIADYIAGSGLDNIAIYYSDDVYGDGFASTLEIALTQHGVTVADRLNTLSDTNVNRIRDRWRAFDCGGVIIAAVMPEAAAAVNLVQSMGLDLPIFGADNFDRRSFLPSIAGSHERLYYARYHDDDLDVDFRDRFVAAYGQMPDVFAINAYECVTLLCDAMNAAQSTEGADIAAFLKGIEDYPTVSTTLTYNADTQEFDGQPLVVVPMQQ